ncbi:MAG: Gx transporter family protein [Eubacterium sp.]|nr:Gx transporter family protein [Eubacterium sp.]MCM1214672.1 Gx transporter family protein [Lachnospiraceae bacterium]MCM1239493.1 Gx transporter family protein [Lachnospiraceae bacterium]
MTLRKLTALALYTTLSLAVYAIESAIPPLVPLPGIKLGLANIITLILLQHDTPRDAFLVLTARLLLSTLLFGQFLSLLYSLAGGVLSFAVMYIANRLLRKRLPFLTGALGGLSHNLGQLLAAFAITATTGVFAYLPYLAISGILTGLFTGLCAHFAGRYLLVHLKNADSA